ncbi:DUF3047 domain-containing protein [uncultured Porticoccus sp.]|uniref:DUF3047 domain-containing protein n=1 Tax=uncultured Porticoccus sp. TaxID=1256050 RepID=UPI0030D822B0
MLPSLSSPTTCRAMAVWLKISLITALLPCSGIALAEVDRIDVGNFSEGQLDQWNTKVFTGKTDYALVPDDGRQVLRADSRASASGLYREIAIDLKQTPLLNWSWKVNDLLTGNNERHKAGDDYPARLYVVFSGGLRFWRTRAINYVWSSNQPAGSEWPNAFTSNARMIAVRGSRGLQDQWVQEQRDVLADYRRLFGEDPGEIAAVALMTDTDNTGLSARAWYGDIWFSAAPEAGD